MLPAKCAGRADVPVLVADAGPNARFAFDEFFGGIDSEHTVRAYRTAVRRFLGWCGERGLALATILPGHISEYVKTLRARGTDGDDGELLAKPSRKLHLSAIRRFLDKMVERHAIPLNVALSVRGPRHSATLGRTMPLRPRDAGAVYAVIDTTTSIGLRDRAMLATLIYTAARVGSVVRARRRDFFTDGKQFILRLDEKGGKQRDIPCRLDLQEFIEAYLHATSEFAEDAPLFLSHAGHRRQALGRGLSPSDVFRMVRRRLAAAGLPASRFSCHSFRAGTATDLLDQGVALADVQELLGHADPRVTRVYDHRSREVSRNIVERISNWQKQPR
jgi:integrase/recombinase XerD